MADTPVEVLCNNCGEWSKPSTAQDGQKKRCKYCKYNVTVIRYPELHPRSSIGLNVRPVTPVTPKARKAVAVKSRNRLPAATPSRRVLEGSVSEDTVTVRSMVSDVGHMVAERRERKATLARTRANPLTVMTPPDISTRPCEFCADAGRRPNGRYPVATHRITTILSEVLLACRDHAYMMHTAHLVNKVEIITHMPTPGPNYRERGIGDVPEHPDLPRLREEARQRELAEAARNTETITQPSVADRISGALAKLR